MADKFFIFSIFAAFALSLSPFVFSRELSLDTDSHSSVLDVSGSIRKTLDVLSHKSSVSKPSDQRDEKTTSFSPTSLASSFSLELHPRELLHGGSHKDYRALMLSRLARDSARVKAINTKLQLAVSGTDKSDLVPMDTEILHPQDFSTPVTSGTSQGSGEYFLRVGIGRPSKTFYMVIDTGSDVNWLQCKPCDDCYQQVDPIFDPASSSSFSRLGCQTPQCRNLDVFACRNDSCLYQVSYGDGSYTVGDFATETVSFGNSGSVDKVAIGCGHDNEGLFVGAAGLIGLGGGPLSLTSQIKASSFSYCLVNRDSVDSSTLEFNSAKPSDSVTAPIFKNSKVDTFYYVGITGMSVGGEKLAIPPTIFEVDGSGKGGIIVDCGTAVTRLQTQAYNALRDTFVKLTKDLPSTSGFALFDTCYNLSSRTSVRVPTVAFLFDGGKSLPLPPSNYLIPVDSAGTFCLAFAPTTASLSIIGNVQQQGTRVTYDLANSQVSFSSRKC